MDDFYADDFSDNFNPKGWTEKDWFLYLKKSDAEIMLVLFHPHLHPFEQILWNNTWHTIWDHDVFVPIFPDVFPITQHAVKVVRTERLLFLRQDMSFIQRSDNAANRFALCISLINLPHNRGSQWINFEMLVVGQLIAERNPTAVVFALQRIFRKTPVDLLRQFR